MHVRGAVQEKERISSLLCASKNERSSSLSLVLGFVNIAGTVTAMESVEVGEGGGPKSI